MAKIHEHTYGIQGLFQAVLRRYNADGTYTDKVGADWQENLITNFGMNGAYNNLLYQYVSVGTGSTAPAETDTALVARLATQQQSAQPTITSTTSSPYYNEYTYNFTFTTGAVVGNITELGLHYSSTSYTSLVTRALFKDGSGVPTSIPVTAEDQLIITYKIRIYLPENTTTNVFTVNGTDYTVTLRPAQLSSTRNSSTVLSNGIGLTQIGGLSVTSYYGGSAVIGPITGTPTGTNGSDTVTVTRAAYVTGNFYADYTISFALASANRNQLQVWTHSTPCPSYWQWSVSPAITKTNTQTLSFTHRVTWARYVP